MTSFVRNQAKFAGLALAEQDREEREERAQLEAKFAALALAEQDRGQRGQLGDKPNT